MALLNIDLFKQLPTEIQEHIIHFTFDSTFAALMQSRSCYKDLTNLNIHNDKKVKVLHNLARNGCVRTLWWLYNTGLERFEDILTTAMLSSDLVIFEKLFYLFPFCDTRMLNKLFQSSLTTRDIQKTKFIISRKFVPLTIENVRPLKHPLFLLQLFEILPFDILMKQEIVSIAMESNNSTYLEMTERHFDARKNISTRDLILSARKGAVDSLKWFHKICPCSKSNYIKCIFDECVFEACLKSKQNQVMNWLQNDTNCAMRKMGYPHSGYLPGYGNGDLSSTRGFVWFMR